jgi:hypothetical protein
MGGRERKVFQLRLIVSLIALAGTTVFVPVAVGATSAAASVAVAAPSCMPIGGSKVDCNESSTPNSTAITWYITEQAVTPPNFTISGNKDIVFGCAGPMTVHFSYVSSGVTYVSGNAKTPCIKGEP